MSNEITTPNQLFRYERELDEAYAKGSGQFMKCALMWLRIHDQKLHKIKKMAFREYVHDRAYISVRTVYRMIAVARAFAPALSSGEASLVNWDRITDVARFVKTPEQAQTLLDAARDQTDNGWNDVVQEFKGKLTSDKCQHEETMIVEYTICLHCPAKWRKEK